MLKSQPVSKLPFTLSLLSQKYLLFTVFTIFFLTTPTNPAIVDLGVKCQGNKVLISNVCVECPVGQIIQDTKCVKLQDFNFSSLGPLGQKNCIQSTSTIVNANSLGKCVRCLGTFELYRGVCITKGCLVFSQVLMKCLDSLTELDLLLLKSYQMRQKTSALEDQLAFVLPVPLQRFIEIKRDDVVELGLEIVNKKLQISNKI